MQCIRQKDSQAAHSQIVSHDATEIEPVGTSIMPERMSVKLEVARACQPDSRDLQPTESYKASGSSQLTQDLGGFRFVNRLPMRCQNAVAVFLRTAHILQLLGRRRVVDVTVGVAGYEGKIVR